MNKKQSERPVILRACLFGIGLLIVLTGGCHQPGHPRQRVGAFFGSPAGIFYPDPENLGRHRFAPSSKEKTGMVYTCKGGFIDIGHLREAADRTAYIQDLLSDNLHRKKTEITFKVIEPSVYHVSLTYPPDWHCLEKKEKQALIEQVSIKMAQSFAHTSLVWHEILTWFGFSSLGIFPERISAFSPEDTYSDLLGVILGGRALQEPQYNRAMTLLLDKTLKELEVQPAETARRAEQEIIGKWYRGGFYFFVDMKKRNFDTGFDGRPIIPWLVPDICPDAQPHPLEAPTLNSPTIGGFQAHLKIYPVEVERFKIYRILNLDPSQPIEPEMHFPVLLMEIRQQEELRSGSAAVEPDCCQDDAAADCSGSVVWAGAFLPRKTIT